MELQEKKKNRTEQKTDMQNKEKALLTQLDEIAKQDLCLAFSGGVDSSLLLKLVMDASAKYGTKVYAVTFQTRLHPPCDLETATRVAKEVGAVHEVLFVDELEYVEQHPSLGPVLHLTGADLMDGTPILDIKPYLPHVDSHVEALGSFTEKTKEYFIPVEIPDELLEKVPADHRAALKKVLEQDPRPSYQNSEERVYGLSFAGMEIKFQVKDEVLHVVGVEM